MMPLWRCSHFGTALPAGLITLGLTPSILRPGGDISRFRLGFAGGGGVIEMICVCVCVCVCVCDAHSFRRQS